MVQDTYSKVENGIETVYRYFDLENGDYSESETFIKMATTVVTALDTVMIPRNLNEFAKLNKNIFKAFNYVWIIGIPITFGIAAIAPNFIPCFFGDDYSKCILLLFMFSPLAVLMRISNTLGAQYLIPTRQDKKNTQDVL